MRTRTVIGTTVLALGIVGAPGVPAAGQAPPSAQVLFGRYRAGERAAVVAEIAAAPDIDRLTRDISRRVTAWARDREGTADVRLGVAAFLLDAAAARLETDWFLVRDFVEIGCRLLAPIPDHTEAIRRWHLAALALAEGAVDTALLLDRPGRGYESFGHLAHSRLKFPDEPRFRLAEVVVNAMGFADQAPPRDRRIATDEELVAAGSTGRAELAMRRGRRQALADFVALTGTPDVADEAHLRAGHQAYQLNENDQALEHLRAAAGADDPFIAYNAHLISAMVQARRDDRSAAEASLRRALEAVPFAQAATQLLSSQLFLAGRAGEAHDLVERWFARRPRPADPWRLFGYGDFRLLPALLVEMRKDVVR